MNRALPLLAALFISACGNGHQAEDPIRPVLTVTVAPGAAATREVYSGELRARVETDLAFRIGGKIATRLVDAGAHVKKGQVLARLDPQDAKLAAEGARAQLASAEADHALAKSEFDRAGDLLARKFISQSAWDARQAAYTAAKARVDQARSQAALSTNQAAYTTLAADADGVVVSVAAEPGQVVAAGQPVLRLARDGEMEVVVNAPESQVARFRPGQDVVVFLWADPANRFPGRVREIAGGADPVTRTFTVRVSAPRVPPGARVGMSATVAFKAETDAGLVVLPLTALVREADSATVWVVDPKTSRVQRRAVTVGQFREDGVTVLSGLAAGEIVVSAGVHKLRADQAVRFAAARSPDAHRPDASAVR
ncbi:MAG TPA: efflux RND transporter periplasmic adaptor subunit [Usitatibacteraceae bacterium]|nr:efflux RND transporter periplasmic adaptor subunit [Usitatibacteraceae bacterium]